LAIIPCHRTSYKKFVLGFFEEENERLTGNLIANNIPLANAIYSTGFFTKPKCSTCMLNHNCIKYCIGANYENQDLFYPIQENCELQKAKSIFLLHKYRKLGLFDSEESGEQAKALFKNIEEMEPMVEKWNIAS
jgi:radical SAM protein with 4Fe4S-binding SPASM domain